MIAKGLIHIHSNYSDGELTLKEIKNRAQVLGMNFIFLADHLSLIEVEKNGFEEFKRECEALSGEKLLVIPGFEIETKENYHVLVYNGRISVKDGLSIRELFEIFSDQDVFLVLAHVSQISKKPPQELLEKVDAIEVWNARYDSKYAPDMKSLKWIKGTSLVPFIGSDAHGILGLEKLWVEVEIERLEVKQIIDSLKKNKFKVTNNFTLINLKEPFTFFQFFYFKMINLFLAPIRNLFVFWIKKGFQPPDFIKKIFQRFY